MEAKVDFIAIGRQMRYGLKALSVLVLLVAAFLCFGWIMVNLLPLGIALMVVLLAWLIGWVHEVDGTTPFWF
jgi:hypothetical protein